MVSSTNLQGKAVFSAGGLGVLMLIFPLIGFFVHPIIGILLLIGVLWATYRLFSFFLRVLVEAEANKRRAYTERRQSLARLETDLFDDAIATLDEGGLPSIHLATCRCKACR